MGNGVSRSLLGLLLAVSAPSNALAVVSYMPSPGSNSQDAGGGGPCTYEYETHDGSPVVTSAQCTITDVDLNTGSEPTEKARSYVRQLGEHDGCGNDDAGHILANQLGGYAVPTNLFPQSPHLNRGKWEQFEKKIKACMQSSFAETTTEFKAAHLSWKFHYASSTHQRPGAATYSVTYTGGACEDTSQEFDNLCSDASASSVGHVRQMPLIVSANATTADALAVNASSGARSKMRPEVRLEARAKVYKEALSQTVLLIRHGEKSDGDDLSPRGYQRANCLGQRSRLGGVGLTHLFAYTDKASRRSVETLQPLADATGLSIDTRFGRDDVDGLAGALADLPRDAIALVCWEHKVLTDIANAIGVDNPPDYGKDDYDTMWTVQEGSLTKSSENC